MDWQIRDYLATISTPELEWFYFDMIETKKNHAKAIESLDHHETFEPGLQRVVSAYGGIGSDIPPSCGYIMYYVNYRFSVFFDACAVGNGFRGGETCNALRQALTDARNMYANEGCNG